MPLDLAATALADLPITRASALTSAARHSPIGSARNITVALHPALPGLQGILGEPGLRAAASYLIESSTSLGLAMLAAPTQAGSWGAVVGLPHLGPQAAGNLGVDLDRLALVPDPRHRWLEVVATLADAVEVILVQPPSRARDVDIRRLNARMRSSGTTLIVLGQSWPGSVLRLSVSDSVWTGLRDDGHGHLAARHALVTAVGKVSVHSERMWLPAADGSVRPVLEHEISQPRRLMRAV